MRYYGTYNRDKCTADKEHTYFIHYNLVNELTRIFAIYYHTDVKLQHLLLSLYKYMSTKINTSVGNT